MLALIGEEKEIRKAAAGARRQIGDGWVERQKDKGYSGLTVRDLAASYGLMKYYLSLYRHQSHAVHGMNASKFFEYDASDKLRLNLGPSPDSIGAILACATIVALGSIQVIDSRLGLEFEPEIKSMLMRSSDTKA